MTQGTKVFIIDRSELAQNLYKTILKPLGCSCFAFKGLKDFHGYWDHQFKKGLLLVGENAFGSQLDHYLNWIKEEGSLDNFGKIFLVSAKESGSKEKMEKLGMVLQKPFHPLELYKCVTKWEKS